MPDKPSPKKKYRDNRVAKHAPIRKVLSLQEIQEAFRYDLRFPPILSLEQAAELSHLAASTLKRLVSEQVICYSVRRGKPVAFWRDRFVKEIMNLDRARQRKRHRQAQKGGPSHEAD